MSTAQRVIKNSSYLYLRIGVTTILSLWTTRLILEKLGVTDFGIYNLVGGVISTLSFLNAAMAGATQRFMSYSVGENDIEKQKKIFNISILLHAIIASIIALLFLSIGVFLFRYTLNIPTGRTFAAFVVYGSLVVSTIFSILSVPYDAILNAHENMLYYSIVGIIDALMRLGIAFSLSYIAGDKLIVYSVLMAFVPITALTIMRIYCHNKYKECIIAPRKYYDKNLMSEMSRFASWNFLPNVSNIFVLQGSSIIINAFWGVAVNAAHGIANMLAGYLLVFSNNMQKALNPVIVKKEGEHHRTDMVNYSLTGNKFSYLLFAFFAIPCCIEMPYILNLWLKEPPAYTVIFCQLIIARRLIGQMTVTFSTSIGATGKIKQRSIVNSIIMIVSLPVAWCIYKIGFPVYSIYVILALMVLATSISDIYFMNKLCALKLSLFIKTVFLPNLLITIITFGLTMPLLMCMESSFMRLICVCICSSIIFCISTYYIGLMPNEKNIIHSLLNKIARKCMRKS